MALVESKHEHSSRSSREAHAYRSPSDANGGTVRSSHVLEDGRMILAPLVNIQKTSRQQNARGYDAPSRMGILSEAQKMSGSSQVRERPISHTGSTTWMARARP